MAGATEQNAAQFRERTPDYSAGQAGGIRPHGAAGRPVAARGHMPFADHRTIAEIDGAGTRCSACHETRLHACSYARCPVGRR